MTFFNIESSFTPAQLHVLQRDKMIGLVFEGFVRAYMQEFDAFWRHPTLTPQEINEAWGIKALELFQNSAATKAYILARNPNALPLEYLDPLLPVQPEIVDGVPTGRMIIG